MEKLEDWLARFRTRHPDITLRSPEPTSLARARGFNRPQVERFYANLWELLEKHKFSVTSIYNMDETGIMSNSNKPPKIFTTRGKKQVGMIASSERGQLTTVICCCSAAGTFIPPYFIFARKRMQERLMDGAPPGSQGSCTDNGWVNGPTFLLWLKHFVEIVRPTEERKCLLLLDNHESHKFYPALEFASRNNVIFLSFAPHTTNKMQPLDVTVYGPIKKYFEQELNTFQKNHVGRIINQYDMCRLFTAAYLKGATAQNAVSGFSKTGIYPYNPNVFGEEDFAPASLTDHPQEIPVNENGKESLEYSSDEDIPLINFVKKGTGSSNSSFPSSLVTDPNLAKTSDKTLFPQSSIPPVAKSPVALTSKNFDSLLPATSKLTLKSSCISQPSSSILSNVRVSSSPVPVASTSKNLDNFLPVTTPKLSMELPSTSQAACSTPETSRVSLNESQQYVSPFDVRPVPKMAPTSTSSRKRKSQKSEVLTSTPIKEEQLEKFNIKVSKENKQAVTKPLFTKTADKKKRKKNVDGKPSATSSEKDCDCLTCGEPF